MLVVADAGPIIALSSVGLLKLLPRLFGTVTLDAGEAAALTIAARARADLVLIDELRGRQTARKMGLAIKGTLGVLVSAKRSGLIDAVGPVLDALAARDFWFTDDLRARLLAEVGE